MSQFPAEMEPEKEQQPVEKDAAGRGTQGAVGELGFSSGGRAAPEGVPDPELAETARRRRYSAKYKLSIVREADACLKPGEVGALLRREGLYSSHLGKWRVQRDAGALGALEPRQRGPRPPSADAVEVVKLRRERDSARSDLETARRVIEVQGNVSALLEELLSKNATATDDARTGAGIHAHGIAPRDLRARARRRSRRCKCWGHGIAAAGRATMLVGASD